MTAASVRKNDKVVILSEIKEDVDEVRAIFSRFNRDENDKKIPILKYWVLDLFYGFISLLYYQTDLTVEEIAAIFRSLSSIRELPDEISSEYGKIFSDQIERIDGLNRKERFEAKEQLIGIASFLEFEPVIIAYAVKLKETSKNIDKAQRSVLYLLYILWDIHHLCRIKDS